MAENEQNKVKIRLKLRSGEEFEAEGSPDFIEKQAEELQKEISEIDEKLNKIASKPAIKKYDEIMKSFEIIKEYL